MDTAKKAVGAVKSGLGAAAAAVTSEGSPVHAVGGFVVEELGQAKRLLAEQAAKIKELKEEKVQLLRQIEEEKKRAIADRLAARLERVFDFVMDKVLVHVKEAAKDEYMPQFVKNIVDSFIECVWPDVTAEVREVALAKMAPKQPLAHGQPPCCYTPRIYLKYTLYPYDRTFWRKVRNPWWWLFNVVSVIPRYAIPTIMYIILFFVLDKGDEFQLLQFITQFKSLQFVSLGVLSAMIGSVQYYVCTTQMPSTCDSFAPQEQVFTLALFIVQAVVIWIAFLLSFRAKKKGGKYYQMTKQARQEEAVNRKEGKEATKKKLHSIIVGDAVSSLTFEHSKELEWTSRRRMMWFLVYDLFVFLLCALLTVWVIHGNLLANDMSADVDSVQLLFSHENWRFTATLYWIKAFYGLMSFPFLALIVPGVNSIVSHARPTGYNPYGRTVPYLGVEEPNAPWRPPPPEDAAADAPPTVVSPSASPERSRDLYDVEVPLVPVDADAERADL